MAERHAEIAGAGFAGLTLATALAQRGWSVRVHEAAATPRAFGAGIFLWENGLQVLSGVGALEEVLAHCHQATAFEDRDDQGRLLGSRPLPMPGGARMVTLTRQALYDAVVGAARRHGVEIRPGSKVAAADPAGRLKADDGADWPGDLIVGADGIRSIIRDQSGLAGEHRVFSIGVFRLLLPRRLAPTDAEMWHQYVNFWNVAARRRVLYVPCGDDELYLLLGAVAEDREALVTPLDARVWVDSFPVLGEVLEHLPQQPRFDHYEAVRAQAWATGRLALLGDAAHAMPPTLGQGAGTGMANALALATTLEDDDVHDALPAWEAAHRPMTDETQGASIALADSMFTGDVNAGDDWASDVVPPALRSDPSR